MFTFRVDSPVQRNISCLLQALLRHLLCLTSFQLPWQRCLVAQRITGKGKQYGMISKQGDFEVMLNVGVANDIKSIADLFQIKYTFIIKSIA
ncbi:hypothetical protein CEXT_331021 [Caerostris extrusa]|uniref:Uncharacterized protein n=1 Tax=Caerostris extrusa TaxID=172846 RepID=A0AAV4V9G6_CAEEX|nr:hypothetical protein CEXT_331021 [Caerostris extrusa]